MSETQTDSAEGNWAVLVKVELVKAEQKAPVICQLSIARDYPISLSLLPTLRQNDIQPKPQRRHWFCDEWHEENRKKQMKKKQQFLL